LDVPIPAVGKPARNPAILRTPISVLQARSKDAWPSSVSAVTQFVNGPSPRISA
jgi:hypothetical protein